jgi:hypothetical protein
MSALNALLTGLVDFAGLFPPASLDMRSAVRAFATYRQGPYARILGAFVVPAGRLDDFARELDAFGGEDPSGRAWMVSVIAGEAVDADIGRALGFEPSGGRGPAVQLASIEVKAESAGDVERASASVPRAMTMAVEIPLSLGRDDRLSVLSAVKAAGRIAKLRTGGVAPDAIPSPGQVAEFIWDCARTGVRFKATAGLHHPLRAEQRLTYAPDSPRAMTHGFVNVFLAAVAAWKAVQPGSAANSIEPPAAVYGILEERDTSAFRLDGGSISWRGVTLAAADIARARGGLARSFGSCSFVEPISDLEALGWLPWR